MCVKLNSSKMKYWKFWCFLLYVFLLCKNGVSFNLAGREDIERIDVREGETLTLTCRARSHLLRSYRWVYIREGTRKPRVLTSGRRLVVAEPRLTIEAVPVGKDVNLILRYRDIRPYEAGLFMCWKKNLKPDPKVHVRVIKVGTEKVEIVTVKISAPSHVKYGATAMITCLISPSWPGKVIWLKNEVIISESDRVYIPTIEEKENGDLLASLEIVSIRDSANYTCKIRSSPLSKASVYLDVKVAKIESLSSYPKRNEIEYGQHLSITCLVSQTDSKVLWLKDGAKLDVEQNDLNGIRNIYETLPNGEIKSVLDIQKFSQSNNGQYVCYVPGDSKSFLINIEGRPPVIIGVKGWDFIVGDVLRLTCTVQYNRLGREVTWLFNGERLPNDWYPELVTRQDIHNITHNDLGLPIPTSRHVGTYSCTAPFGSASVDVREIILPYLLNNIAEEVLVKENGSVTLPCSIMGYPVPFTSWEKYIDSHWKLIEEAATEGHTSVDNIGIVMESISERREHGIEKIGEKSTLSIDNFVEQNQGQYRCRGSNEHEEVFIETELRLKPPTPEIVHTSADSVVEGEDLVITCTVSNSVEKVRFEKDYVLMGQGDTQRHAVSFVSYNEGTNEETFALVISNAEIEDSGTYECSSGSEAQAYVVATVKPAPPVIIEVAASPAIENGEFFVSCTIKNMFTDNEVSFYFDGRNLNTEEGPKYSTHLAESKGESIVDSRPRAKLATYVIKVAQVTTNDSGLYRCVLDAQEKSVLVEVEELANIEEVDLKASSAWLGGDLVLSCSVANWDGEISFFHNATMLLEEEDSRYFLSHKQEGNYTVHVLTIFDVSSQDSGFYQCFTSPFVSAEINVTIKDLDSISLTLEHIPSDTKVAVGSSTLLNCRVVGFGKHEHTVEISHDGRPFLYVDTSVTGAQVNPRVTPIEDTEEEEVNSVINYKVRLNNVEESDNGVWACRATVPEAGLVLEDTTKVEVLVGLKFINIPDSEYAPYEGDNVTIKCSAEGFPEPEITWYKADDEISLINTSGLAQLFLVSITDNDAGMYTCVASSLQQTISTQTILKITKRDKLVEEIELSFPKERLTIIEMPMRLLTLEEGSSVDLRCVADGTASPFVMWLKNDTQEVLASGHNYVIYSIDNIAPSDAGKYVCKATFNGEEASDFTTLIIIRKEEEEVSPINLAPIVTTESTPDFTTSSTSTATFPPVIPTIRTGKLINLSGPESVQLDDEFTLLCLVSPLLSKYEFLIIFNEMILTIGDTLLSADTRMRIVNGVGPIGEMMVALKIQNARQEDAGTYKCTANTDPAVSDDHDIQVVPQGFVPTTTTVAPPHQTTLETQEETTFLDSVATTKTTTLIPDLTQYDDYETLEDDNYNDYEDKVTVPTSFENTTVAKVGSNASMMCLTYILDGNISPVYFWVKDTTRLLSAGPTLITSDRRISVEYDHILDEATSTLTIVDVVEEDSGVYICSLDGKDAFSYEQELVVISDEGFSEPEVEVILSKSSDESEGGVDYVDQYIVELDSTTKSSEIIISTEDARTTQEILVGSFDENGTPLVFDETGTPLTNDYVYPDVLSIEEIMKIVKDADERNKVLKSQPVESTTIRQIEEIEIVSTVEPEEIMDQNSQELEEHFPTDILLIEDVSDEVEDQSKVDDEDLLEKEEVVHPESEESSISQEDSVEIGEDSPLDTDKIDTVEEKIEGHPDEDVTEDHIEEKETERHIEEKETESHFEEDEIEGQPEEELKEDHSEENEPPLKEVDDDQAGFGIDDQFDETEEDYSEEIDDDYEEKGEEDVSESVDNEISEEIEEDFDSNKKPSEPIIIIATAGEDVKVPADAEVILPCPTDAISEDITWKDSNNLLFLGSLDLAGVDGLSLSHDGELKLLSEVVETKKGKTYTCFVFDYDSNKDVKVTSFKVDLINEDATVGPKLLPTDVDTVTAIVPTSIYEFPGLEWQEVAVISNSKVSGESLFEALKDAGIKAL